MTLHAEWLSEDVVILAEHRETQVKITVLVRSRATNHYVPCCTLFGTEAVRKLEKLGARLRYQIKKHNDD